MLVTLSLTMPLLAQVDVTSINTTTTTGTSSSRAIGESTTTPTPFTQVNYNGVVTSVTSFNAGGVNYLPELNGVVRIVRNGLDGTFTSSPSTAINNPNQNAEFNYRASSSGTTLTVRGEYINNLTTLVTRNNLNTGIENLFINSLTAGDQSVAMNIERIDFVFAGGLTASAARGFAVFERGLFGGGSRGRFRMAAITSLNAGVPTGFSNTVLDFDGNAGTPWGNTNLVTSGGYDVFRYRVQNDTGLNHHQDNFASSQGIGATFVPSNAFATNGTTLFGYSIFARDVTAFGNALANLANYPTTTNTTDGDMDLIVTGAQIYAVPEPTTYALLALGGVAGIITWYVRQQRRQHQLQAEVVVSE